MEKIASIFCIGLLIFYLLLLIALVVTPLFKQRKLKPQTGKSGKGGYGGPHSGQMTGYEDEQPVPFAGKRQPKYPSPRPGRRRNLPRPTHSGGGFRQLGVGGIRRYRAYAVPAIKTTARNRTGAEIRDWHQRHLCHLSQRCLI